MEGVLARSFLRDIGRILLQLRWIGDKIAAQDLDAALCADEDRTQLVMVVLLRLLQFNQRAAGIAHRDASGGAWLFRPDFDRAGFGSTQGRLYLVERMRAPAGDAPGLAAAVVVPPARP